MDIIVALLNHHKELRHLLEKTKANPKYFSELKKSLEIHHINEEKYLLDHSKEKDSLKDESLESIEEHHAIVLMLEDLDNFPMSNDRWKVKLKVLKEYLEHHLKEEEEDLFPEAYKDLNDDELVRLGNEYEKTKEKQMAIL